ncbi:MAG: zinc-ribbon domain-containing protein [Nanoarchaeota archaeon]|nr:zinc-ribbon domain-containing protein [Nanoarchaeota archaeon]
MFGNKKYCKNCREKVSSKYRFCPNCGAEIKEYNEEDWGMLGREDVLGEESFESPFFAGFGGKMLNSMLGNAFKMLEKEMKNMEKTPGSNFRLMINGKEIQIGRQKKPKEAIRKITRKEFGKEQLKKISELPKKEPKTSLKRIGDKIIYEIEMPEVKSLNDVLINNLENSIEIKAIGESEVYSKIIPINMPIINQTLSEGKLFLELNGN